MTTTRHLHSRSLPAGLGSTHQPLTPLYYRVRLLAQFTVLLPPVHTDHLAQRPIVLLWRPLRSVKTHTKTQRTLGLGVWIEFKRFF